MGMYPTRIKKERKTIERAYNSVASNIKKSTRLLEQQFSGIDIRAIPSYRTALRAIDRLRDDALRRHAFIERFHQLMAY